MTARTGMTQLISDLRVLTEAGASEWVLGTVTFWDDAQLQNVLDRTVQEFILSPMDSLPTYSSGGTLLYNDYQIKFGNIEQTTGGTAIFYVQDGNYNTVGTALYTSDYRRGKVTFSASTEGTTSFYATGRSYDLNAAAAEVWRIKANHVANSFDFTTDNTSVRKSQVYQHYVDRAEHFESLSTSGVSQAALHRSDDVIG